jgi:DNA-binding transcriptional ArsR family regulator
MLVIPAAESLATKAKLFRGFSDPSRLSILEALREGPRTVGETVELTGLSQSNVSNHLACLLDCGLVSRAQQGRFAYYSLADERVEALLALSDQLLSDVARGVRCCPRYARTEGEPS